MTTTWRLAKILLHGKTSARFIVGVLLSFSFSITVILGTIGIMDGFDHALKLGLKRSSGDITFFTEEGFFKINQEMEDIFKYHGINQVSGLVRTEGYLISDFGHRGIIIKGVDSDSFSQVTGLSIKIGPREIVLGEDLAQQLEVTKGNEVVVALANGNEGFSSLPLLKRFKVSGIVKHGVYVKDSRFAYVDKRTLQKYLGLEDKVNLVSLNLPQGNKIGSAASEKYLEKVLEFTKSIKSELGGLYIVRPFWSDFVALIEAVKIQKLTIGLILQLIVIIAIFNILAFIIFLREKKAQTLFLVQALGVCRSQLNRVWGIILLGLWFGSCLLSLVMVQALDLILKHCSLFKLPGDVYGLSKLSLKLGISEYVLVFCLALAWLLVLGYFVLKRLGQRSLASELRKEFA